jgi:hypothetical protein
MLFLPPFLPLLHKTYQIPRQPLTLLGEMSNVSLVVERQNIVSSVALICIFVTFNLENPKERQCF